MTNEDEFKIIIENLLLNKLESLSLDCSSLLASNIRLLIQTVEKGRKLKKLALYNNTFMHQVILDIAEFLKTKSCCLLELELSGNELNGNDILPLIEALKLNNTVQCLNLRHNNIDVIGVTCIATLFKQNKTLTKVNLSLNNIDEQGALLLANVIESESSLQCLDISYNDIGDAGAIHLGKALMKSKTLQRLNLNYNKIQEAGARQLAQGLKFNKSLCYLGLSGTPLGSKAMQCLANSLKENDTLQELSLKDNKLDNHELQLLAQVLKTNQTLQSLDLANNHFTVKTMQLFSEAMKTNHTLRNIQFGPTIFVELKDSSDLIKTIDQFLKRNQNYYKLIFLLGLHPRCGNQSALYNTVVSPSNGHYEKNLLPIIFSFTDPKCDEKLIKKKKLQHHPNKNS